MKGSTYQYQLVTVLNPKTEAEVKEESLKKISSWLEGRDAQVTKKDHFGLKELVYQIQGHDKGDFWVLDVDSKTPIKLNDLNLLLNRETNIIRYLILKV